MNKKITIILFIIIVTCVSFCSYQYFDKIDNTITIREENNIFFKEVKKGEKIEIPVTNNNIKNIYKKLELYYIPKIYEDFESYNDNHFYMDKLVTYDSLSDESKLYYSYKNINNIKRKYLNSCEELKGFKFNKENLYNICLNNELIIKKEYSGDEWIFKDINKKVLEESYHSMYGLDKKMPLKNFTMDYTGACVYSVEKDDYICFTQTGGDENMNKSLTMLEKAIKYHDYIEIYDRYIWLEYSSTSDMYTLKYYKSRFDKELISTETSYSEESINNDIYKQGALYKHTFKLDKNGNYYWYSSDRIE